MEDDDGLDVGECLTFHTFGDRPEKVMGRLAHGG